MTSGAGLTEERFRELLDERGVLRKGSLEPPLRSSAFTVFAQRETVALDVEALRRNGAQFFDAKIGITVDKSYPIPIPDADAARVVLAGADGKTSGTRLCYARPTADDDLSAAETAERLQGSTGLGALARRCHTVWLVVFEMEDDRVALAIAAIFASVLLGPILSPDGSELFGVRTARLKLEGAPRPYR